MKVKLFVIIILNTICTQDSSVEIEIDTLKLIDKDNDLYSYQIFNNYQYEKPKSYTFITSFPSDLKKYGEIVFNKNYSTEFIGISLLTGVLIYYDEDLIKKSRFMYDEFNISYTDDMQVLAEPFGQPIRFPSNIGSAFYFIGDGWTHLGISMAFYAMGKINNDNRALQTSSQVLQGMASAGFLTQIIKHLTGRASPFTTISDDATYSWDEGNTNVNDRWDLFPDQIEYHEHVSSYDAFPSGHLAVYMSTLVVITENYPEYPIIKPIGYSLMTMLCLQMMNNGAHWASDYPLSIAMGYYLGKIAVSNGRKYIEETSSLHYQINPIINSESLGINIKFYID